MEGYRAGEHRSPFHGFAIEFAQHREYDVGDDLRHLDWKVIGCKDRYFIKQYEQDTNFGAHIPLDGSESMNYGSGKQTKMEYARTLAACLAHLILGQSDAVGVQVFDREVRERFARTNNPGKDPRVDAPTGPTSSPRRARAWRARCTTSPPRSRRAASRLSSATCSTTGKRSSAR